MSIDLEAIKARLAAPSDIGALVAEVEALRAQVQELKSLGVSLHKAAAAGALAERAAVVAWLRAETYLTLYDDKPNDIADRIERGDHRKEVE